MCRQETREGKGKGHDMKQGSLTGVKLGALRSCGIRSNHLATRALLNCIF